MKPKSIYLIFAILVWIVVFFYSYMVECILYKLHKGQDRTWMSNLTDHILLGVNNRELYKNINRDGTNITFWYNYWFLHTKTDTLFILVNLKNKFSSVLTFNIYGYNYEKDINTRESFDLDFNDIQTSKEKNTITIRIKDLYIQTINLLESKSTLSVNTQKVKLFLNLSITDTYTNCPFFIPRIEPLGNLMNVKGTQTYSPNEWCSDNPYIGKIISGHLNGNEINEGNYWFDNYIGCNNSFLTTYTWFVINNDDWLIYLLWFGDEEEKDSGVYKPIMIKDNKENETIYCGITDAIYDPCSPITKFDYTSNKKMGVDDYDDYTVTFLSSEIDIFIRSKKDTSHKVYEYDYYKNKEADDQFHTFSEWDKEYYKVIRNIKYVEYVVSVDVELNYKKRNRLEHFTTRQIVDVLYRDDKTIPRTITFSEGYIDRSV